MTDNEIVKALECCFDMQCTKCPLNYADCEERDFESLVKRAIPIFNRQKAEIENLNIELQAMKAEVERYEKTVGTLATKKDGTVIATLIGNKTKYIPKKLHENFKNMAVNRAIKEFAEKLKEYYPSIANGIDYTAEEVLKG